MKVKSLLLFLMVLLFACQSDKSKFGPENIPDPKKTGNGYVSDPYHMLSESAVSEANSLISSLDQEGKAQIAVVLQESIGNNDAKDFAHKLFNTWKIGDAATNNGLLIFLVRDAHKLVFETGKGLEGDLPDITCFHIEQDYMIPKIKEDNYDAAFIDGLKSVASLLHTGNYAFDQVTDTLATVDSSLLAADGVAESAVAGDDSLVYAPAQNFAEATPAGDDYTDTYASREPGTGFFIGLIFCFIISYILMYQCFGRRKKIKKKVNSDIPEDMPVNIGDIPNDFLSPGWKGLLLIHVCAWGLLWFLETRFDIRLGFFICLLAYYITWTVFLHFAILIINLRAAAALRGADRHTRWQRLEAAHLHLVFAGFVFPLPFLFLYMRYFKRRQLSLRNTPYECPTCHQLMHKLDEKTEDHYLDKAQVIEEQLQSVDYDVWVCDKDNYQMVLDYTDLHIAIAVCPSCDHKTYQCKKTKTLKRATESSTGRGVKTYLCAACGYSHDYQFIIPKISSSSSSSSGSSSSSSSGSWGGGSSGGGGASSSW
ncbi:YgcG family protein [Chitinophaga sp. Cy-1792]|uniref:TPM domain-containing protein n=1 Tax=Chitinophaga sp. Cy-1792 TaxID=2608339 RepID=UPI00141F5BEA|nr:TPM domain-containing protein [Chitinophaga sp. Cy-1792]